MAINGGQPQQQQKSHNNGLVFGWIIHISIPEEVRKTLSQSTNSFFSRINAIHTKLQAKNKKRLEAGSFNPVL